MADRISKLHRQLVASRARSCCEYCQAQERFSPDTFAIEHIHPRAKGGDDLLENLALACQGCNSRKYTATEAFDPVSGEMVPLFHPRQQTWEEHFRWNDPQTHLIGLSPHGRATVERLQLNRSGLTQLREVLVSAGLHPP